MLIVKENSQYTLFIMAGFVNINVLDVETPISIFYNLVRQIFIFCCFFFTTTQSAATSTSYSRLSKMMPKKKLQSLQIDKDDSIELLKRTATAISMENT